MAEVTIKLPSPLSRLAGRAELRVEGATVGAALQALDSVAPGVRDRICDEHGEVRQHVLVFVNGTNIRELAGVKTALVGGETLVVFPAVSGG